MNNISILSIRVVAGESENSSPSPAVPELGFRRRHRSAMSPAALPSGELPWHGIESRTSEDIQAKLRSRHKSSIDDRRLMIDMDDPARDSQGTYFFILNDYNTYSINCL